MKTYHTKHDLERFQAEVLPLVEKALPLVKELNVISSFSDPDPASSANFSAPFADYLQSVIRVMDQKTTVVSWKDIQHVTYHTSYQNIMRSLEHIAKEDQSEEKRALAVQAYALLEASGMAWWSSVAHYVAYDRNAKQQADDLARRGDEKSALEADFRRRVDEAKQKALPQIAQQADFRARVDEAKRKALPIADRQEHGR